MHRAAPDQLSIPLKIDYLEGTNGRKLLVKTIWVIEETGAIRERLKVWRVANLSWTLEQLAV